MPLIKLQIDPAPEGALADEILREASVLVCAATGKPAKYMMAVLESGVVRMAASIEPAAFVDVRGIGGFTPQINQRLSADICRLLQDKLHIHPERVYVTFTDIAASHWGWNSGTFG